MVLHKIHYYKINRFLGLSIGLWPETDGKLLHIQMCFIIMIFISGLVVQLGVFVTHEYNFMMCLRILTSVIPGVVYLLKYVVFIIYKDKVLHVMRWLEANWKNFSSEMEQLILAKHAKNGKFITILYMVILFTSIAFCSVLWCLPQLLQIAMSGNSTHAKKLPFLLEYFVDPDKYFYYIGLHFLFMNLLGVCVLTATESMSVISVEHGCGLLELASYHIQTIMDDTTLHFKEHSLICEKVKTVIQIHYNALSFMKFLNDSFSNQYVPLLAVGVVSLSMNFYVCAHAILYSGSLDDLFISGVYIIADLGVLFSCCYIGQIVLNQCDDVFIKAYDTEWYSAPLPIQKVLLLFLQRSMKGCTLSCGGIFLSSYRLQLAFCRTSVSYFMMLWSTK